MAEGSVWGPSRGPGFLGSDYQLFIGCGSKIWAAARTQIRTPETYPAPGAGILSVAEFCHGAGASRQAGPCAQYG